MSVWACKLWKQIRLSSLGKLYYFGIRRPRNKFPSVKARGPLSDNMQALGELPRTQDLLEKAIFISKTASTPAATFKRTNVSSNRMFRRYDTNSVDVELQRIDRNTGGRCFINWFVMSSISRHISTCTSYVETVKDSLAKAALGSTELLAPTYPIIGIFSSLSQLVKAHPTTPPAGPDKIDLRPEKFFEQH